MEPERGDVAFVLFDADAEDYQLFESESDLEEYLEEQGLSQDELDEIRVFAVDTEYRVKGGELELEEV